MQQRKRLLITISISFSIRYIVRTGLLDMLQKFCEPVIVITWNEEDLIDELKAKGYEIHVQPVLPEYDKYENVRKKIDIWFRHFRLRKFKPDIEQKYLEQFIPASVKIRKRARELYNIAKFYLPYYKRKLFKEEEEFLHEHPAYKIIQDFVRAIKPEAVFTVTPFHRQEDMLLRVCKEHKLPMLTSILSFDNITKRGWIPVMYDEYMVWNKYNKEELKAIYPEINADKIHVVGAPQFDFYFSSSYLTDETEWRAKYNFKEGQKVILYAGGPAALFPGEPLYPKQIDEAINAQEIKNSPAVLFRCHPIDDIERWKKILGESKNIVFDNSWSGKKKLQSANITENDIRKLCSALAYTDVHVNVCSTMTVDGSAFGKPQIGPAYDTTKKATFLLQQLYQQQHFKPIIQTKGLTIAASETNLTELINKALDTDVKHINASKEIVDAVITYSDGNSTKRVATNIEKFLSKN